MNTGIRLFDVPMKLLVRNGSVTYEDYKAFLIRRLGPWANEHIYPDD